MIVNKKLAIGVLLATHGWFVSGAIAAETDVALLRNTVVNILDTLVEKGVLTQDAVNQLVADAQARAEAEVAARQAETAVEEGDVRVTYVPQVVKDEITEDVKADVQASVVADVKADAMEEGWGVPAALPGWVRNATWGGDIRVRVDQTLFASQNAAGQYLNFQRINEAGGIGNAGIDSFLNTTEDQTRYNIRMRFGADFQLDRNASAVFRLATGDSRNPVSRNQNLGEYGRTFEILLDEAYIQWHTDRQRQNHYFSFWGGRMPNVWSSTSLVWDGDFRFNGLAVQYAWRSDLGGRARGPFLTAGVFPVEEIELATDDKMLYAGQLGWEFGIVDNMKASLAAAYYHYENMTGIRNPPESNLFDATAPQWVQKGNTLFDIRNSTNPDLNLFALAADYELVNITGTWTWLPTPDLRLDLIADYVTNVGYDENEILQRTGALVPEKADGWRLEMVVGAPKIDRPWAWRFTGGYQYLERDAVVDGFTESDFHRGGTDHEGFFLVGHLGLTSRTWIRARWLSFDEIDGPPLGVDVLQVDLNARF